jgi:hypothetical protein
VETGAGESLSTHGANITHNVTPMWREAGIYDALYDSDGKRAGDIIETLRRGIADMEDRPEVYRAMNPKNGWGNYDGALNWLREWLAECVKHPNALIGVSR